jgi:hypothetical protein
MDLVLEQMKEKKKWSLILQCLNWYIQTKLQKTK